jgi:DNA N-6-adenine-methyltransferase (Dam)/Reverse transcriptase (RNA-dependent DNA polymerase)
MRRWLKHGVRIPWRGRPIGPFHKTSPPSTATQRRWWLDGEAHRLKKQGSLFQYPDGVVPEHVSGAFLVPKGADNWRLVVNEKHVNLACIPRKCRYESLKMLQRLDLSGVFAIKVDLKDAYYQVPVHESDRKYFAFEFAGHYYHLNCLTFGWLNSPWYFTKVARVLVQYVRSHKPARSSAAAPSPGNMYSMPGRSGGGAAKVLPYLDDFLFLFQDKESAAAGSTWVQSLLFWLGFTPHERKCVWEPSQRLEHLGLIVDLEKGVFEVPAKKLARLANMAKGLRITASKNCRLVKKQHLASFCGFAQSLRLAVSCAQLFLRALYDACSTVRGWQGSVRLDRQAMADLQWWSSIPVKHCEAPIQLKPGTPELYVDASKQGWGATMAGQEARGYFSPEERCMMIAQLEMRAVRYALLSFRSELQGRCVLLREDNTVTESVIRNACSKSPIMLAEFRLLWALADELHISFKVVRVASADNKADAASRHVDRDDYKLAPAVFDVLSKVYGPFDVDLFASTANAQCPKFFSATRCPGTAGVDALLQSWSGMKCYANPPFCADVMMQVVQKVRLEQAEVLLVVPDWPAQAWHQELLLLADVVDRLPAGVPLFASGVQGGGALAPPPKWGVLAVHVPAGPPFRRWQYLSEVRI